MEFDGTVQNGVVVVDSSAPLPEGAKVKVHVELPTTLGQRLLRFKGVATGLPSDLAENHDHYLHELRICV
jgi:hypothetical protein